MTDLHNEHENREKIRALIDAVTQLNDDLISDGKVSIATGDLPPINRDWLRHRMESLAALAREAGVSLNALPTTTASTFPFLMVSDE